MDEEATSIANFIDWLWPKKHHLVKSRARVLAYFHIIAFLICYYVASIPKAWPLFTAQPIFWSIFIFTAIYNLALQYADIYNILHPKLLMIAYLVLLAMSLVPFIYLCKETEMCNEASSDSSARAAIIACDSALTQGLVDQTNGAACLSLYKLNSNAKATGKCPFLYGDSTGSFLVALQFILLITVILSFLYAQPLFLRLADAYARLEIKIDNAAKRK